VLERVKQDRERLNERVDQLGKTAEWNDWVLEQDGVIVTRHQDPTRGPSLMEFKQCVQQQQLMRKRDEETIRQLRAQLGLPNVQPQTAEEDNEKEPPTSIVHEVQSTERLQQLAPLNEATLQEQPTYLSPAEEEDIARLMNVVDVQQQQQQQQQELEQSQKQKQASKNSRSKKPQTTKKRKSSTPAPPELSDDDIRGMRTWGYQEINNQRNALNPKRQVSFEVFARDIRERYTEWYQWYHRSETEHTTRPYHDYKRWFEDSRDDVAEPDDVFKIWVKVAGIELKSKPVSKLRKVD
jgi:hypothetical protein